MWSREAGYTVLNASGRVVWLLINFTDASMQDGVFLRDCGRRNVDVEEVRTCHIVVARRRLWRHLVQPPARTGEISISPKVRNSNCCQQKQELRRGHMPSPWLLKI